MSEVKRRVEFIQPVTAMHPEIGRWLWTLEETRRHTNDVLDQVDADLLDWKPEWALHSIGTLLYHITLIEADWLHVEVQGHLNDEPYPVQIAALLPYPVRSHNGLTPVTGVGLTEHRQRLAAIRQWVLDAYRVMSLEDFYRVRSLPDSDVTPEWVLYHLVEHEIEHRAEMAALHTQFSKMRDNHAN